MKISNTLTKQRQPSRAKIHHRIQWVEEAVKHARAKLMELLRQEVVQALMKNAVLLLTALSLLIQEGVVEVVLCLLWLLPVGRPIFLPSLILEQVWMGRFLRVKLIENKKKNRKLM